MNDITKKFITDHCSDDIRTLALQAKRYPDVDMREAVTQIEGWQLAQHKLPQWAACEDVIYPPRISMEQCSSESTALYKASLACGERLTDLTGGFGIDCSYMSRNFAHATYIERNSLLCTIAQKNFATLGLRNIEIISGESEDILPQLPQNDWIFIDPARRDGDGRKVVALADCTPNVVALKEPLLSKSPRIMIKCSPMLDVTAACNELQSVTEIHIVATNNECKELLFIVERERRESPATHCVNITKCGTERFTFTADEEATATVTYTSEIGGYLYEPNAAIQKGGCYRRLAQATGTRKLHPNSHLYTSDELVKEFPGRTFKVEEMLGFTKSDIKRVSELKKANITTRNHPDSVQALRKRLKLADGGDKYIFATTLADGHRALILCSKAQ